MHTFLVRIWVPADGRTLQTELRGVLRQVATGTETTFRGDDELLGILRQATAHPDGHPGRSLGAARDGERTIR